MVAGCETSETVRTVVVEREVEVVVEREVEVFKEVEVEVTREVPIVETVVVEKVVEVEVVKEVAGETVVQTVIVEREVEVAGETVLQTVIVERQVPVEVTREVIVEKVVYVDSVATTTLEPTKSPTAQQTATASPVPVSPTTQPSPTPIPSPTMPPTPTPLPLTEIKFAGVTTSTNFPSQVQVVFALRDQNGHSVVLPADRIERGITVFENGSGTDGWEEIDYSETSFFVNTAENIDLEVVFVLDFTNSMYEAKLAGGRTGIDAMLDAFSAALSVLPSAHRVGVVEFHDRNVEPSVLSGLSTDRQAIISKVQRFADSGFDHGSSRVWDGVARGTRLFSSRESNPRAVRALVFLSDGRDISSETSRDALAGIARDRGAQLYALGVGEVFQPAGMRGLAVDTGGGYYVARDVSRLQTELQLLVNDLRGQYQLSYITLRRTGDYRAALNLRLGSLETEVTTDRFDAQSFFGNDNLGVVEYDPPSLDRSSGVATVYVRDGHVPRNVDRIRFSPGRSNLSSFQLVPSADGGLLEGWTLTGPDVLSFYEASSSEPIQFGASGLLFKLTYSGLSDRYHEIRGTFDNSIYAGGKQFANPAKTYVGNQPRIAFMSDRDGDHEIYIMNADGSGVLQLTDNDSGDWAPSWSPDGRRIAFYSDRDGDWEIYVMNADGTGVVRLTDNDSADIRQRWSPSGQRIAFSSDRDGDHEIYIMNADGTGVVQLTDNDDGDRLPTFSPDGNRIAFSSDRDGDYEIYIMNADGTGVVQLTDNSSSDWVRSWSSDGGHISFNSYRDGEDGEIYVMNADGSG